MVIKDLIVSLAVIRAAMLLPVFATGVWFGARYFRKADDKLYRQVALGLLLCVAVFGVLR